MPTRREIDNAEAGGEPLQPAEKLACLVIPVRCAHCLKLTPDVDLHRCGGCKHVGYCDEAPPGQTKTCHKAHWKAGHKQECARFAAEAKAEEAEAAAMGPGCGRWGWRWRQEEEGEEGEEPPSLSGE